ncbi:hypothetical protein OHA79_31690 [Streptomyces sp. NBC_00841]|uniref:AMP-binding enzyme n=1 Tax=Streptomyces sp. NBC_01669 TaxID=2975909 RepID=UPI00224FBEBD|nr:MULTISPECIES: hypothetical protein [unclassified Streptomyces]MCX4532504.1 hypothetical protein [Streptomyces sp. NBC_01669]WSA02009.1 hypothetical protein OHA79_31690 [Streptomyces sp. NBC_00841]
MGGDDAFGDLGPADEEHLGEPVVERRRPTALDLGVRDADGFLSIVDRKKELVIRGGVNIYPREVEEVLVRHPAVSEVAVIGVPDEKRGEEICAVVVARTDADPVTADELIAWSRERLGRHTYPRIVRFTEALPLGPTGKVLKRALTASS